MSNIPECERTIIPNVEWQPERVYCKEGATVSCYKIIECNTSVLSIRETIVVDIENPLFVMTFINKEVADNLMEDLYLGEYTGA